MPAQKRVFDTERLVIRPAAEQDVELLYELWTDPRVMAYVGFPHGLRITRQEIEQRLQEPFESEFERVLVVERKDTGQAIGECGMHAPDEAGIAGTDVKLLPAFWGHRYGVEVKRGLVSHLFTHTRCTAVEATPNVDNVASIKMQEAVGGVRTGEQVYEFPESMRDYTTPVHHYIYRVHREDWEREQPGG
ncbi:MAG: GNAT family N-acetyltransferase [Anaerolineae bacterium]|nr:GNAT family N-acetyltransferase [Anaerolineae bacterium]